VFGDAEMTTALLERLAAAAISSKSERDSFRFKASSIATKGSRGRPIL
jgi:hypothetical protein